MNLIKMYSGGYGASRVHFFAESVLFDDQFDCGSWGKPVYAMSIIGPEQAIRAVAAGCSVRAESRIALNATLPTGASLTLRWTERWNAFSRTFSGGMTHLVAITAPKEITDKEESDDEAKIDPNTKVQTHVIIPSPNAKREPTAAEIQTAIYFRLCESYTTPLIPVDSPGQSEAERKAGYDWMKTVVSAIRADPTLWAPLSQIGSGLPCWKGAGLLKMSQTKLDNLVSALVMARKLKIPVPHECAAVA